MIDVKGIDPDDIVWLFKGVGQPGIQAGLDKFTGESKYCELDKNGNVVTPRWIVATTSSFGIGITLTEGLWICLVEPDTRTHVTKQAIYRIYRQGNKNKVVFAITLYVENVELEEKILKGNINRETLGQATRRKNT